MKLKNSILCALLGLSASAAYGQQEKPINPYAPQPAATSSRTEPATTDPQGKPVNPYAPQPKVPATPVKAPPANVVEQWEPATGDAVKDLFMIRTNKGGCNNGLMPLSITNTSDNRPITAKVEMTTKYGGHINKKITTYDDMAPGEVRSIGCMGCIETAFKSCFTYRIVTATYKELVPKQP